MFGFFVLLAAVWLLLSGYLTALPLACGVVSCALVAWIARRMDVVDREGHPVHLGGEIPGYWAWLAREMLISGWTTMKLILGPKARIAPVVEYIPIDQPSDLTRATLANSITLTPGTLSIRVERDRIEVHALEDGMLDDLRNGRFGKRVAQLEDE